MARLNNRDSFPSLEYKSIWEARIKLAKATQQKLAELHEDTIARYNDILDNEVIDEMAGTISDTPPMAPNPRPAPPTADTGPERGLSR